MNSTMAFGLLLAAIVQPLAAGIPRYHCLARGQDGFACCCAPAPASERGHPAAVVEPCCSAAQTSAAASGHANSSHVDRLPSCCGCCEVYFAGAFAVSPLEGSEQVRSAAACAAAPLTELRASTPRFTATAAREIPLPPDTPLFLLHCEFLV